MGLTQELRELRENRLKELAKEEDEACRQYVDYVIETCKDTVVDLKTGVVLKDFAKFGNRNYEPPSWDFPPPSLNPMGAKILSMLRSQTDLTIEVALFSKTEEIPKRFLFETFRVPMLVITF